MNLDSLRERYGLKADCRCTCGLNIFSMAPVLFTNPDGRSLSSNMGETPSCSIYIVTCLSGERYLLAAQPKDHENTLIPLLSPEAAEILKLMAPDFNAETMADVVKVEK